MQLTCTNRPFGLTIKFTRNSSRWSWVVRYQSEPGLMRMTDFCSPELGWSRMRNDLRLRAEKADVVRDVALQRFPNLFSCETLFSRSLKVCLWNLATGNVLARRADHQEPRSQRPTTASLSVILPRGFHPFPSRTRKLSPAGPIVLHAKVCGRVGRRRHINKGYQQKCW